MVTEEELNDVMQCLIVGDQLRDIAERCAEVVRDRLQRFVNEDVTPQLCTQMAEEMLTAVRELAGPSAELHFDEATNSLRMTMTPVPVADFIHLEFVV